MSRFFRTLLIGIGIGLLIAPMPGKEMRRRVNETFQNLFGSAPESGRLHEYTPSSSGQTSQTVRDLKQVAETAEDSSQARTMTGTTYEPAYPEYVNPEKNP